jgi:hypothetical protein
MPRILHVGHVGGRVAATVAASVGIAVVTGIWTGTAAHAGQPWRCLCNGEIKRSVASTYACETSLYRGTGRRVSEGFKLFVPACTRPQFRTWNRRACAKIGCTLVPQ